MIDQLKARVKADPVLNDVMHVLALRERSRTTLNFRALKRRMAVEGFNHPGMEYRRVLFDLAKLGLGHIARGSRGRIIGLRGIQVNLPAVAREVLGTVVKHPRRVTKPKVLRELNDASPLTFGLVVKMDGKEVRIDIPQGTSPKVVRYLADKLIGA